MNDQGAAAQPVTAREQGWWRVMLAIALFLLVPLTPMFRVLLPIDQTVLLIAPVLAVCALLGWWAGGRIGLAVVWTVLAGWMLWRTTAGGPPFAFVSAGWAVLLAVVFALTMLFRRPEEGPRLLPRALATIGVTLAVGAVSVFTLPGGRDGLQALVRGELAQRAAAATAVWQMTTGSPTWQRLGNDPALARQIEEQIQKMPEVASVLFVALLALESLVALALAWAIYHRVGRARVGPPLAPLREFRFNDQLVWGFIAGLVFVLIPGFAGSVGATAGANLLFFFGALYALRGLGLVLWLLSPGPFVMTLLVVLGIFFWPVLGSLALGIGVGDTWIDWRNRVRRKVDEQHS